VATVGRENEWVKCNGCKCGGALSAGTVPPASAPHAKIDNPSANATRRPTTKARENDAGSLDN
jgi:hypothetical protein